jgi:hypothetical protein
MKKFKGGLVYLMNLKDIPFWVWFLSGYLWGCVVMTTAILLIMAGSKV